MEITLLKKVIIPLVVIGVLGYFGFVLFIAEPVSSELEVVESTTSGGSTTGEEIIVLINKLRNSSMDQTIFSSEAFLKLKDFGIVLSPEPQGRSNPFASIGVESGSVATTYTTATSTR